MWYCGAFAIIANAQCVRTTLLISGIYTFKQCENHLILNTTQFLRLTQTPSSVK